MVLGRTGLFVWVGLAYALVFLWMPRGGFWINDNGLKFIQVDGLVRSGFSRLAIEWPGREVDPEFVFGPLTSGFMHLAGNELHAAYSPVFAMLAAPGYAAFGFVGLGLLPLASVLLALWAVRVLALAVAPRASRERVATVAVLAAAFGTPLFWYSQTFWEHGPAVACSCLGFAACVKYRLNPSVRMAAQVGALCGSAAWFRTDAYLLGAVVLLCTWLGARERLRDGAVLGGAFLASLAPLWLFHYVAFGDPLGPHLKSQPWAEIQLAPYLGSRAVTASNMLFRAHGSDLLSALASLPFVTLVLFRSRLRGDALRWAVPAAAGAAFLAGCVGFAGHLSAARPMNWLMVSNGLFTAAPLCMLGLLRASRGEHEGPEGRGAANEAARTALFGIAMAYALLFALFVPEVNSRGIHWGNRFLLPLYPLLSVLAAAAIVSWWDCYGAGRSAARTAIGAVILVSVALQVYGLVLLHDRRAFTRSLNERVLASALDLVVTDTWFLPVDLGPAFYQKSIFFVPRSGRREFRALAREHGLDAALSIERKTLPRERPASQGEPPTLDDGWLHFSPVSLREVRLQGAPAESP